MRRLLANAGPIRAAPRRGAPAVHASASRRRPPATTTRDAEISDLSPTWGDAPADSRALSLRRPVERVAPMLDLQTLVLNADYRPLSYNPLSLWSWKDAFTALFLDRVT